MGHCWAVDSLNPFWLCDKQNKSKMFPSPSLVRKALWGQCELFQTRWEFFLNRSVTGVKRLYRWHRFIIKLPLDSVLSSCPDNLNDSSFFNTLRDNMPVWEVFAFSFYPFILGAVATLPIFCNTMEYSSREGISRAKMSPPYVTHENTTVQKGSRTNPTPLL